MKYRKLRIAWSVAWGVAAVLLVVLWVRSYSQADHVVHVDNKSVRTHAYCDWGLIGLSRTVDPFEARALGDVAGSGWRYIGRPPSGRDFPLPKFEWLWVAGNISVRLPTILLAIAFVVAAIVPWLRWRYSLRTLLIATTLIAVVLGIIMWMSRAG